MTNEQTTNSNEYTEKEALAQDDVINEEIEQEHKGCENKCCQVLFEEASKKNKKMMNEKITNPNYLPISVNFTLETIKFLDITEFNNKAYLPTEIDEERKKYIQSKLYDETYNDLKELGTLIGNKEYCTTSLRTQAQLLNTPNLLKELIAKMPKNFNP